MKKRIAGILLIIVAVGIIFNGMAYAACVSTASEAAQASTANQAAAEAKKTAATETTTSVERYDSSEASYQKNNYARDAEATKQLWKETKMKVEAALAAAADQD